MSKPIKVNETSIIDLKAELFRKEEHFVQKKSADLLSGETQKQQGSKTLDKLALLTGKKKSAPKKFANKDEEVSISQIQQDESEFKRAKLCLQSKAEIYEKLKNGEMEDEEDEEGDSLYLVDFFRKSEPGSSTKGNEWVEFEDALGRQRKCLRKDLSKFQEVDPLFRPVDKNSQGVSEDMSLDNGVSNRQLEDAHREQLKAKWQQEQDDMVNNPHKDIHYQNIQFDEVREHGAGYYQFSKEETERKAQMESLNKLREQLPVSPNGSCLEADFGPVRFIDRVQSPRRVSQINDAVFQNQKSYSESKYVGLISECCGIVKTVEQRARSEKIKAKRQAVLAARLAKVREKKLLKQQQNSLLSSSATPSLQEDAQVNPIITESEPASEGSEDITNPAAKASVVHKESQADSRKINANEEHVNSVIASESSRKPPSILAKDVSSTIPGPSLKTSTSASKSSVHRWIEAQRGDRNPDFAPPSIYDSPQQRQPNWPKK
eukprot:gene503-1149_t